MRILKYMTCRSTFIEAADWVIWQLTGIETRNTCTAGYKAIWHKHDGYPSNDFFKALNPKMENLVDEKLSRNLLPVGTKAGSITAAAAKLTGLKEGTRRRSGQCGCTCINTGSGYHIFR
jgi:L-ribulokinase